MAFSTFMDQLGDRNPQLLREIKGQYNPRNLTLTVILSVIGQFFVFFVFDSKLPTLNQTSGRYGTGSPPPNWDGYIPHNGFYNWELGSLTINWSLWWLDIFITLSIIGIFSLLVIGTYLLIADLSKEENRGTLNFIRLSPQSARSLFVGKLLGVPSLVYVAAFSVIPFHLFAGIKAGISLGLIFAFYGVLIASCTFFFNAALLLGLVTAKLGGFQAFISSGVLTLFLAIMTAATLHGHYINHTPFDWLTLFYPGTFLPYLTEATFINPDLIKYLPPYELQDLKWYGGALWHHSLLGMGLIIGNFALWTYWITQGLKRRFRNPLTPLLTKWQSYGLSLCFIVVLLGFTLQTTNQSKLVDNVQMLQALMGIYCLILIAALSPHRALLLDWTRYRHQLKTERKSLVKDLLFGQKSPAILAISVNLGLMITYILPSLLIFSFNGHRLAIFMGLLLGGNILSICAIVAQWLLMQRNSKRVLWAMAGIGSIVILPFVTFAILGMSPYDAPRLWLSTTLPLITIEKAGLMGVCLSLLGQWTVMVVGSIMMAKQLHKAGESETKRLLSA